MGFLRASLALALILGAVTIGPRRSTGAADILATMTWESNLMAVYLQLVSQSHAILSYLVIGMLFVL